ncbi:MAG TPA: hypothetical protein PLQ89_16225 [Phycisphaerae bacterium]|nr:hypothetical protein [Phycisphaerae bacterium]HOQ87261.1 hypothetical protein [Phycisphaerae bacterium]
MKQPAQPQPVVHQAQEYAAKPASIGVRRGNTNRYGTKAIQASQCAFSGQ